MRVKMTLLVAAAALFSSQFLGTAAEETSELMDFDEDEDDEERSADPALASGSDVQEIILTDEQKKVLTSALGPEVVEAGVGSILQALADMSEEDLTAFLKTIPAESIDGSSTGPPPKTKKSKKTTESDSDGKIKPITPEQIKVLVETFGVDTVKAGPDAIASELQQMSKKERAAFTEKIHADSESAEDRRLRR